MIGNRAYRVGYMIIDELALTRALTLERTRHSAGLADLTHRISQFDLSRGGILVSRRLQIRRERLHAILCERHTAECREAMTVTPRMPSRTQDHQGWGKIIAVAAGQDKTHAGATTAEPPGVRSRPAGRVPLAQLCYMVEHLPAESAKKSSVLLLWREWGFGYQWAYSSEEFSEEPVRLSKCRKMSGIIDERQALIGCLDVGVVLRGQRSQRDHVTFALKRKNGTSKRVPSRRASYEMSSSYICVVDHWNPVNTCKDRGACISGTKAPVEITVSDPDWA